MKIKTLVILLSAFPILSFAEPSAEGQQLAKELTSLLGMDKLQENGFAAMAPMVEGLAKRLQLDPEATEELKAIYKAWYVEDLDQEKLRENATQLYADAFTPDELKELLQFYQTPIGKKTITVMPEITKRSAMLGMQEAQSKQALLQARLQPFMEKHGPKQQPQPVPAGE